MSVNNASNDAKSGGATRPSAVGQAASCTLRTNASTAAAVIGDSVSKSDLRASSTRVSPSSAANCKIRKYSFTLRPGRLDSSCRRRSKPTSGNIESRYRNSKTPSANQVLDRGN
jgi:hypothetical protein